MTRWIPLIALFALSFTASHAQESILGLWENIDDEDGRAKSHIRIYKKDDGLIYGKVEKLLPAADVTTCVKCPEEMQGKPLEGLDILWGLKPYKDYYSYGEILDPSKGKIYKLNVKREGKTLTLRGYIGFSLIGRSQTWHWVGE